MKNPDYLFTGESVSEGHPDKVGDRISDAVVDAYLTGNPESRCGVETLCTTHHVVLAGEVRGPDTITHADLEEIARSAIRDIGYEQDGFHWQLYARISADGHFGRAPDPDGGFSWEKDDLVDRLKSAFGSS